MIDLVGRRWIFYLLSFAIIVPGLVSLIIPPHLKLGVDFTGGTLWELQFQQPVQPAQVKDVLAAHGYGDAIVQTSGDRDVLIRAKEIPADQPFKAEIARDLTDRFGQPTELRFETVG